MPTDLLPVLPFTASYGSSVSREPRVRSVKFGDGYEERAPEKINNNPRMLNCIFGKRTNVEAKAIEDFFAERGGYKTFVWTPYPPYDTVGQFICKKWDVKGNEYNSWDVSALIEEKFQALAVLPTPLSANFPTSLGTNQSNTTTILFNVTPNFLPLSNYSSFPSGTRFYINFKHTATAGPAGTNILRALPDLTEGATNDALADMAAGKAILFDPLATSTGAALSAASFYGGANEWSLVRIAAFHDLYTSSFQFRGIYPRNTGRASLPA